MAFGKAAKSLDDRIAELHSEIVRLIAERVEAARVPGVPASVTEKTMTARAGHCRCLAVKLLDLGSDRPKAA